MSASAWPLALGTGIAAIHLSRGKVGPYRRNLWGSTAAGVVALGLLFGSLFGSDLSSSSTAGLIFLFVPIYSAIALGIGYGLGALAHRKAGANIGTDSAAPAISRHSRYSIWVPTAMLGVLLFGMLRYSVLHNDLAVAERASNPETLHEAFRKATTGEADAFGVPLFLAQNPNTPADILEQLSTHEHSSVRIFVVRHANTSLAAVARMSGDCDPQIREEARTRLRTASASNNVLQPTPNCGAPESKR